MGRGALVAALLLCAQGVAAEGGVRGTVKLVLVQPDGTRTPLPDASGAVVYVPDFDQDPDKELGGRIEQKNKTFVPDVLPIVKGQTVEFVNRDPFLHNVFSNSKALGRGKKLDLGKYRGPSGTRTWKFTRTGLVDIYCDIHESMAATVMVLPNRAFTRPDKAGAFRLDHLPVGHHVVYVWARRGKKAAADVVIQDGKVAQLSPLTVEVPPGVEPHEDRGGKDYGRHSKGYGD